MFFSTVYPNHMEIIKMRDNQLLIEFLIKLWRSRRTDLIISKSQGNRHMKKDFISRISFVLENIVVIYGQRFLLLFHASWSEENFRFSIEFYIGLTFKKLLPIKGLEIWSFWFSFKIFGRNLKEEDWSVFYSLFNQFFIDFSPIEQIALLLNFSIKLRNILIVFCGLKLEIEDFPILVFWQCWLVKIDQSMEIWEIEAFFRLFETSFGIQL